MARRQRPSGRKVNQRSGRGGVASKFGRASATSRASKSRIGRSRSQIKEGTGGRRRPQPKEAAPSRERGAKKKLTRPQLRKRALKGADASKVRALAGQNTGATSRNIQNKAPVRKRPVTKGVSSANVRNVAPSSGGLNRASNATPKPKAPASNAPRKFQKGGEVEPLNDAHVKAFEANQAPTLAKAKAKGRSGRKTLGEAATDARSRGSRGTSTRRVAPRAITPSRKLLPGESEGEMLIRTGRRKPKK